MGWQSLGAAKAKFTVWGNLFLFIYWTFFGLVLSNFGPNTQFSIPEISYI